MTDKTNIILGDGAGAVTVYTTSVEKIYSKILVKISPPQSTANWAAGPKSTKIVDLLRMEFRLSIQNSYIDSADETKLETLFKQGGVFKVNWNSTIYYANFDKLSIKSGATKEGEQDELPVSMTLVVGVNI